MHLNFLFFSFSRKYAVSFLLRDCGGLSTYSLPGSSAHADTLKEQKQKVSPKQISGGISETVLQDTQRLLPRFLEDKGD